MEYEISLVTAVGISVLFALSLNLITGFCGQISLGHAAFLGVGAYTSGMLAKAGVPFLLTLPLAMLLAGALGVVVGLASLRVRADFLAITTMGVGFLFVGVVRQQEVFGAEMGISAIPDSGASKLVFMLFTVALALAAGLLSSYVHRCWMGRVFAAIAEDEDTVRVLGIDVPQFKLTAFALGVTMLVTVGVLNLLRSATGRAFIAIRDSEISAQSMGIHLAGYKTLAFSLSAAIVGLAGALSAHKLRFISPDQFGIGQSVDLLLLVVVGGIGSVIGVTVSAAVLSVLPSWFQLIGDYKLLVYGGLLFLMMRFSPGGMAALVTRIVRRDRGTAT